MNKYVKLGCATLACAALVGCGTKTPTETETPVTDTTSTPVVEKVETPETGPITTTAIVTSLDGSILALETADNMEGTAYVGEVLVDINNLDQDSIVELENLEIGDYVTLTYAGGMTMSLPPQLLGQVTITETDPLEAMPQEDVTDELTEEVEGETEEAPTEETTKDEVTEETTEEAEEKTVKEDTTKVA